VRKGGIRLELENKQINSKINAKVIHNYGHGGSGVTLCWGCASEAVDLIKQDLGANSNLKLTSKL
jgi:D-amino-acid oxidase